MKDFAETTMLPPERRAIRSRTPADDVARERELRDQKRERLLMLTRNEGYTEGFKRGSRRCLSMWVYGAGTGIAIGAAAAILLIPQI